MNAPPLFKGRLGAPPISGSSHPSLQRRGTRRGKIFLQTKIPSRRVGKEGDYRSPRPQAFCRLKGTKESDSRLHADHQPLLSRQLLRELEGLGGGNAEDLVDEIAVQYVGGNAAVLFGSPGSQQ